MNQTATVQEIHDKIVESSKSPFTQHRKIRNIEVGEYCRQGDVYITRIDKLTPGWRPSTNRQMAPGTSPGSRHIVSAGPKLFASPETMPRIDTKYGTTLLGPQIHAEKGFTLTHPEHAHMQLPAGDYQCSFQLDFANQRAVRD